MTKLIAALCLGFLALPVAAQQATPAGRIDEVEGDVRILDAASKPRPVKAGETVYEGDSVVTGSDGELHLAMEDEAQLAVRPNTRMSIVRYRAEGGSGDSSTISLLQGALRSVTGWIGKYNPRGYSLRTPTATIGVRGTDHETRVIPEGSGEGEAGTYDKVNQGATLLSTKHGSTEVRPDQAGFASLAGRARPRVLPQVPAFYRPARMDARFEKLHERVRERIDERRKARIETLRERRQNTDAKQRSERRQEFERKRAERRSQLDQRREQRREQRPGAAGENRRERLQERRQGGERSPAAGRSAETRGERALRRQDDFSPGSGGGRGGDRGEGRGGPHGRGR